MRTTDERMKLIEARTAALKTRRSRKKQTALDLACAAACLLLIVGLGAWMPGFMENLSAGGTVHASGAASLIGDSAALGYILMGVLAFLLGVCCIVLLYRLRRRREYRHRTKSGANRDEL